MEEMEIRNWEILPYAHRDGEYINGRVYGNPKFADGTIVHTSRITDIERTETKLIVHTRNSIYHLPLDSKYQGWYN